MSICYDWGEGSGLVLYEKPCNTEKEGKLYRLHLSCKIYLNWWLPPRHT